MQDVLTALAKLARLDEAAQDIEEELKRIPSGLDEMRDNLKLLETALQAERDRKEDAEEVQKTQRADIVARQESLARARTKAGQARNVKEMNASEREIDANRRLIKEREEDAAKLEEALVTFAATLEDHESKLAEFRKLYDESNAEAEARTSELNAEKDKALAGRETFVEQVPVPIYRRYERLRQARGTGVAMAESAACPACRMSMSAQVFNELQVGSELHQCSSCNRYLIWAGWLGEEAEEAAPEAEDSTGAVPEAVVEAAIEPEAAPTASAEG